MVEEYLALNERLNNLDDFVENYKIAKEEAFLSDPYMDYNVMGFDSFLEAEREKLVKRLEYLKSNILTDK